MVRNGAPGRFCGAIGVWVGSMPPSEGKTREIASYWISGVGRSRRSPGRETHWQLGNPVAIASAAAHASPSEGKIRDAMAGRIPSRVNPVEWPFHGKPRTPRLTPPWTCRTR